MGQTVTAGGSRDKANEGGGQGTLRESDGKGCEEE